MGKNGYNIVVALLGKSASGKSTIEQYIANTLGFKRVVSTTTRPIRANEKQDVDYHFVTEAVFMALKDLDKFIEYRYYDTLEGDKPSRWHYGIERDEIDLTKSSSVVVVDTKGLEDLEKEFGSENVLSFYIDVPYETRKIRATARDRNFEEDEFLRRNKDDDIKFENIKDKVDVIVKNNNLEECISTILSDIEHVLKLKTYYSQYASY